MAVDPFQSLTDMSRALARGEVTSAALTETCLSRIAQHDPALNAFAHVDAEAALATAKAHDALRASGVILGPLHGLPIAVKDLAHWRDRPCGGGSKTLDGKISTEDATIITRLLQAGMVIVGKTQMVEFAFGGWGTNPILGTPHNPWDMTTHRIPGGSSSGSGVAVGAGLVPAAMGSDTGGSIRLPAALNGVVGLKPTYGRISLSGCLPLSPTLDSNGPLTRTVEDAALLLAALAGPDAKDAATLTAPTLDPEAWRHRRTRNARIAVMREEDFPMAIADDCLAAFHEAQVVLRDLGMTLEPVPVPFDFADLTHRNGRLIAAEAFAYHGPAVFDETLPFGPHVRKRIQAGADVSATEYMALREHQRQTVQTWARFMADYDSLLLPALPFSAVPLTEVDENATPLALFTRPANYCGACAISVPAGLGASGMPVGVQFMAKPFDEAMLLAVAAAYEAAVSFTARPQLDAA